MTAPALVNVGDVLAGKYRVDRILGIGGMGMVVAATQLELDQKVALKFMLPGMLASAQATERFLREARAVVRLRSEHVCRVFDVGRLDTGASYIVMELMEGQDLAQLLEVRRVLPLREVVDLMLQALEGIAEAHANGIVHRDLKPANLFVATDSDGSPLVKVLDFGISKSTVGGQATKTGEIMGSPSYMAPEQMQSSKDVDARADIWALGVILYEAVGGRLPFEQDSLPALCMAVLFEEPPRLDTFSPAPPAFASVILRCMSKSRDARYEDVGSLATALAPFGSDDAVASAVRIMKVLRRSSIGVSQSAPWMAKTVHADSSPALPVGRQSTLSSGASESLGNLELGPPRRRWTLPLAFLGALVGALVVVLAATSGRRASNRDAPPAAAAAPTPDPVVAPPAPLDAAVPLAPPRDAVMEVATPALPPVDAAVRAPAPSAASIRPSPPRRPPTAPPPRRASEPVIRAAPPGIVQEPKRTPPPTADPGRPAYKGTQGRIITEYPKD